MVREPLGEEPARVAGSPSMQPPAHRRSNLRLTGLLLLAWFITSFVLVFFARELDFEFFGWPFGFWVAAQGCVVVYLAITWGYAAFMTRLDARHGAQDAPSKDSGIS